MIFSRENAMKNVGGRQNVRRLWWLKHSRNTWFLSPNFNGPMSLFYSLRIRLDPFLFSFRDSYLWAFHGNEVRSPHFWRNMTTMRFLKVLDGWRISLRMQFSKLYWFADLSCHRAGNMKINAFLLPTLCFVFRCWLMMQFSQLHFC